MDYIDIVGAIFVIAHEKVPIVGAVTATKYALHLVDWWEAWHRTLFLLGRNTQRVVLAQNDCRRSTRNILPKIEHRFSRGAGRWVAQRVQQGIRRYLHIRWAGTTTPASILTPCRNVDLRVRV